MMSDIFNIDTEHYRARPFWAWNTEVTADKVRSQIKMFHDMGMGGFVIHSRNGLRTEYMGDQFMDMVRLSIECAEELGLKVWIYDEDRWPSGNSGGVVTTDRRFRQRSLIVTSSCPQGLGQKQNNEDYLVGAYKMEFDADGYLTDYHKVDVSEGDVFAYVHIEDDNPRFNWQANVDVMNKEAISKFIETAYERYYNEIGEHFGKTVEAIFTDEPQGTRAVYADHSDISLFKTAQIMWTDDIPDTYLSEYGEDIVDHIPAILWESENSARVRYRYHEHCAKRFKEAYSAQLGAWCEAHGIAFTGHFIFEETMRTQTNCTKDVMRCYADQHIPGMDVLQGKFELLTALQCRSVAHQDGKKRVMSELYGVNNWDTPFREYIIQGNWQTAMGINVRVHHLTWMSMLGEGKRDYPATFGYQAPWHLDIKLLEDHFSRLHTVLENGKPRVKVGVIHPIESYWTICGPADKTARKCLEKDKSLEQLFRWLSFDGIDFDLINEALLPDQLGEDGVSVGKMKYDAVLVPDCITMRSTTVSALERMRSGGVKVIFAGNAPYLVDGLPNKSAEKLAERCERVEYTYSGITSMLGGYRAFELVGTGCSDYVFSDVDHDGCRWLFLAPASAVGCAEDSSSNEYTLKLKGRVTPQIYDTMTGAIITPEFRYSQTNTYVVLPLHQYQSVLLRIEDKEAAQMPCHKEPTVIKELCLENTLSYAREEDNVVLLDRAEYSLDGKEYLPEEEILHVDTYFRNRLGLSRLTGKFSPQPWSVKDECAHTVYLRFSFYSEIETCCRLAFERVKSVKFNGEDVALSRVGYYVDKDISAVELPQTCIGKNVLDVEIEIGKTYGAEPIYIIGDFDVKLEGTVSTIIAPSDRIAFGSVVHQGMPFYGGSVSYRSEIDVPESRALRVAANYYRCALVKVLLDGKNVGNIILPPYDVVIPNVTAGKHTVELVAVGNRHNTFGSLHWGIEDPYYGPSHWHKNGDAYSREYHLRDFGIMKCPTITLIDA